jgi:signal transduction histidine kinase
MTPRQFWADLSLRTRLLLFALALVTVPGALFALIAFSGTRAALEREVGIQLQQTAERGADAASTALQRAQSDARTWAGQDVMRDLLVGDLDKRVSRFLSTVREGEPQYLAVLCTDASGSVIAASSGEWIGHDLHAWPALRGGAAALVGPLELPDLGREVLEIAVPIQNPDAPRDRIGSLVLVYDWAGIAAVLDAIRIKLAHLGKRVAALLIDGDGRVIGGVTFNGQPAQRSPLAVERWSGFGANGFGERRVTTPADGPSSVLAGVAGVPHASVPWSVVFIERMDEALAPVRAVRRRWILVSAALLAIGLAVAALLARSAVRPLEDITRATSRIAARPDEELPLLPVRSRNEVGQLTESFNRMTTELKRSQEEALTAAKFAFAGELAAMVAHEVRTPLSVMRSSAQMLAGAPGAPGEHNTELVDMIVAEVDRVERVVTGLIQLARPLEQRLEPTALRDVLERATEFAAAYADTQGIRVTCDFAAGQPPALCDGEQIYQVVLNLLVNAVQALPPGGSVRLCTLAPTDGTVGFQVSDDGPGIPADIRDRLFRPFVTGRDSGTGLGLAFVERVVKAHRGSIAVRSEAGRGTVFEIRLPVAEARV